MGSQIKKIGYYIPAALAVTIPLAVLETLSRLDYIKGFILPAPSAVLIALVKHSDEMAVHIKETLWVGFVGFTISIAVAFVIAVAMDRVPAVKKTVYPLLIASQTVPIMVITPVIILLIGYGLLPKILVVVLVCFFPVCISLYDGLCGADSDMLMLMKSMDAGELQKLKHVKLPAAMPSFFSGIRISAAYCIMATVIAEWQGSNIGLGIYMMRLKRSYLYDRMFAAILLIVLLSLLFFITAYIIERRVVKWKR